MTVHYGPWAIARLRAGADINSINPDRLTGDWRELYGALRVAQNGDRAAAFMRFVNAHPNGKAILQAVANVPPTLTEFPEPDEAAQNARDRRIVVEVPDLPKPARLTPAMERAAAETGEFLDTYAGYVKQIANTLPCDFSEAAALAIASIAVARRLHVTTYFEPAIYPVLWVLWVAESTIFHKTTALNVARRLIRATMPHLLLPDESSSDRLIQELAGIEPVNLHKMPHEQQSRWRKAMLHAGQRAIVIDEASSLFGSFRKDYNIGKIEVFLKAYDCDDEKTYSTIRHGQVTMRWLYLPMLGATTPAAIQSAANLQMWQVGLWPRFVTLVPERMFPERITHSDAPIPRPPSLDRTITALLERLPQPDETPEPGGGPQSKEPVSLDVAIAAEAWRHWTRYNEALSYDLQHPDVTPDDRLRKMYGRNAVRVLQTATLLSALDWAVSGRQEAPRITLAHYARAHQIAETWRVNAHRFVEVMDRPLEGADREARLIAMIRYLNARGEMVTIRNLTRYLNWRRDDVVVLLQQMTADGLLEEANSESSRTKVWRLIQT
ncbi:MAG: DUF3987 domain-containing protein [Anaerolineales bacterium]|nr:DUF3987 domain-containing protein [Anaerolineales bacterium]